MRCPPAGRQSRPSIGLIRSEWQVNKQHGEPVLSMEGWGMFGRREAGNDR